MVRRALYRRVHDTDVYVLLVRTAEKWSRLKRGQACTLQTRPRYRRIRPISANGRKVVAYHFTDASRIRQYTGQSTRRRIRQIFRLLIDLSGPITPTLEVASIELYPRWGKGRVHCPQTSLPWDVIWFTSVECVSCPYLI